MAGIVAGVGMVAAMSFAGATPETSSTVDSLIGGLPSFLAQLNLGIVALVVNLVVMAGVSAVTRGFRAPRRRRADSSERSRSSGALLAERRRGGAGRPPAPAGRDALARRAPARASTASACRRRARWPRTGATGTTGARPRPSCNGFAQFTRRTALHCIVEGDGPPLLLLHGWPRSVWEFHRADPAAARVLRGSSCRRCRATGSRSARPARFGIVEMARRAPRADGRRSGTSATSSPAATGARSIARAGSRTRTRTPSQALHLYMMPLRRPETWPESERRVARGARRTGRRRRAATSHIQGTRPQTLAYGLADSPVGLMSWIAEKFDALDRLARRPARRRADDRDDLLGHGHDRHVVLAVLRAHARRAGCSTTWSRPAGGSRAPLTYLDFPKEIVHVPRAVAEPAFDDRALGDAGLRRALPGAGGDRRARRQPAALRQPIATIFSSRAPRGVSSFDGRRPRARRRAPCPPASRSTACPRAGAASGGGDERVGRAACRTCASSTSTRAAEARRPRSASRPRAPRRRAAARGCAGSSSPGAPDRSWRRGTRSSP